jgi:hypothetical protein
MQMQLEDLSEGRPLPKFKDNTFLERSFAVPSALALESFRENLILRGAV